MTHQRRPMERRSIFGCLAGGCCAALLLTGLTGCQSDARIAQATDENVALAAFAGTEDLYRPMPDMYQMGAGDSLGQTVFIEYIAWIRSTQPEEELRYATGAQPLPDVD